jgi:hypothetical protein
VPSRRKAKPYAFVTACVAAVGVGLLLTGTLSGGHTKATTVVAARSAASDPVSVAGTPATFSYLAAQRTNRCGLTPAELESYPEAQRLQGSCCNPMDLSTYEWQVKALHRYASIQQIPRDPYDVPVSLARRLLRYDNAIHLSARQQATYDLAMHMSREKGPCCCHCWRWTAFRGMSKYLIARGHWTASQVALIIDDVEGCGGKDAPPSIPAQAAT